MILIGQYDSPFVRRVGVALHLYGLAYDHRPWSVFADRAQLVRFNPLARVPALVLADGDVLIESGAILDYLDELAGPAAALIARGGPARRRALKLCALASGVAEKAVALVYERALHPSTAAAAWVARLQDQMRDALDALEASREAGETAFWFGARIGHADIMLACAWRFAREAHPALFETQRWPALGALADACEATDAFRRVSQPFIGPP